MDRKLLKSILFIVTYTLLLGLVLIKFDEITGLLGEMLALLRPLFIGFGIAFVLNRPCQFFFRLYHKALGKRGETAGQGLAVLSSYIMLLLIIGAIFAFVLPKLGESIQIFASQLNGYIANLQVWANQIAEYFNLTDINLINFTSLQTYLKGAIDAVLTTMSTAAPHLISFTGGIISGIVTLVLAIVFSIYMLGGRETLLGQCRRVLTAYVPPKPAAVVLDVVHLTADTFTNFVSGQLTEACILGGLCALGMLFIQPDYAALIGVIIGVSALVPVAGAYVGAILSAFLLVMVSPVRALIFLVFLVILQQIEGNVIYPRVVGTSIGLPGIWVLAAVTVGGGLFGLVGVLFSVPVASILYTLIKRDVRKRLRTAGEA